MTQASKKNLFKATLLYALLMLEIYFYHKGYPQFRTFAHDLLGGFRAIKVFICLTGLVVVLNLLPRNPVRLPVDGSVAKFLPLHLATMLFVWLTIEPFWALTMSGHIAVAALCWVVVAIAFCGSWLLCLSQPRSLVAFFRAHWPVLCGLTFGLTPLVNLAEGFWSGPFIQATFSGCARLGRLVFPEIIAEPDTCMLGVPEFQVEVGNLCSGFEGMGLIFGFLCVYLWLRRDVLRFPHALIVLPIAVAASWLANIVRIVALIAVGAWIDPALAIGAFHSQAGWVSFLFLAIGFVVIVERFGLFGKEARIAQDVEYPASLFLLPMTVQLVLTLIFSTISSDFDLYYPVRTLIVLAVLYSYRAEMKAQRIFDAPALPALWLGILVYIVWVALIPQAHADRLALPSQLAAIWLLFRLFGSVVVVPIVEELAFRGYLLRRLQNRWFYKVPIGSVSVVSLAVSSIMFGFMHSAVLAGTLAGLAYAYATTLRGRLGDAIFAHAVTNLCIAVHVVALGRWDLWL